MGNLEENSKMLYFSQDVKEIVIVVGNHKFRIYEELIKHFINGTTLVEKVAINKEKFYEFANYVVSITNGWKDAFATISISPEAKWSVVIKTNNDGTKRYAGIDYCPNNWNEFCNTFDKYFFNNTNQNNVPSINDKLSYEEIINIEYNKNGITDNLVKEITRFVISIIEDFEQDVFWSDMARCFLELLILANLIDDKKIDIKKLLYQIAEIAVTKEIILNNLDELKKYSQLQIFTNKVQIMDNDRAFKSILELIENGLIKYYVKHYNEEIDNGEDIEVHKNMAIVIPKKISNITQDTLSNICSYSMNKQEQEKVKILEIDENKYERVIDFIKYIDGVGYVVVDYIIVMVNENGTRAEKKIYNLKVEPELDIDKAKKKINKYLKECYNKNSIQ